MICDGPSMLERGFRRGWADAIERYASAAGRFRSDFLSGYKAGYRQGKASKAIKTSLEESLRAWFTG